MHSRIAWGQVHHRRRAPVEHAFRYPVFMAYLDLDELAPFFRQRWFWSLEKPNLASFRRRDFFGDPSHSLRDSVWDAVDADLGRQPRGAVRLLTNLRYWGYCVNPISLYFCFSPEDRLQAVLADVTNTPWGESWHYVIPVAGEPSGALIRHVSEKKLHVSPFMEMNQEYHWRIRHADAGIRIAISSYQQGEHVFDAAMRLRLHRPGSIRMAMTLLRFPFMTGRVIAAIYWQALCLRLRNVRYVPHPEPSQSRS